MIKQIISVTAPRNAPTQIKEISMAFNRLIANPVWNRPARALAMVVAMLLNWHAAIAVSYGQEDDMDLMEEVAQLERELADPVQEKRDAAEHRLIAIGPKALDWISPVNESMSSDQRDRIRKVRRELESQIAVGLSQPSSITLTGAKSFSAILAEIKKQTGNTVRFEGDNIPEGTCNCDWQGIPFWDVMNDLMAEHRFEINPYTESSNVLELRPSGTRSFDPDSQVPQDRFAPIHTTAGLMWLNVSRVDNSINLTQPALSYSTLDFMVHWEPRLSPITIDVPMKALTFSDDLGNDYAVGSDEVASARVLSTMNGSDFSVHLPLIDRKAQSIRNLDGIMHLLVPGRIERFVFKNIDTAEKGTWQERADARVVFDGIEKNEDLFGLRVVLSFHEANNAMESHYGWVMENPLFLMTPDGEKIEPVGFETFQQNDTEVGMIYLFLEIPPGSSMHYETPAAVVKLDVPFSLKRIPLP